MAVVEREVALATLAEQNVKIDKQLTALESLVDALGLGTSAGLDVFLLRMENKRKGGQNLGEPEHGGDRKSKRTVRLDRPQGISPKEAYRWRALRWQISQSDWNSQVEAHRELVKPDGDPDDGRLKVKWSQNDYLALARKNQPPPSIIKTPGYPDGPFRTIVVDPPWPIEKILLERRPVEREILDYSTMTLEEVGALPIKRLADVRGAHVYLWVTHKFMPMGLELFKVWGVRYECLLTWMKPTAQPLWWKYNTEHALFGKVGSLAPLVKGESVGFHAPQQKHSHKPNEFFDLVRRVSPEPRLTMFDGARVNFENWGVVHE